MEISDYAHYIVLLLLLLKRHLWLRSLRCFTSLTMLTTLSLFTTVKMKSLTALTTLFQFTITKMKYLNTLTMVFLLSLLLKWYLWLRSLHCFTFTAIKMTSLTTFTTRFCFITTNPKDRAILTTLLLSLMKLPRNFSVPIKFVCATVISLSGNSVESYMLYYPNHDVEIKKLWLVYKFLGHQNILNLQRVLGPHKILSPPKVLGPHRVLVPGSSQGSGFRFYGMPV